MGGDLFHIRCSKCGRQEIDTWMGDVYPMGRDMPVVQEDGSVVIEYRTKCCGAPISAIRREKVGPDWSYRLPHRKNLKSVPWGMFERDKIRTKQLRSVNANKNIPGVDIG